MRVRRRLRFPLLVTPGPRQTPPLLDLPVPRALDSQAPVRHRRPRPRTGRSRLRTPGRLVSILSALAMSVGRQPKEPSMQKLLSIIALTALAFIKPVSDPAAAK